MKQMAESLVLNMAWLAAERGTVDCEGSNYLTVCCICHKQEHDDSGVVMFPLALSDFDASIARHFLVGSHERIRPSEANLTTKVSMGGLDILRSMSARAGISYLHASLTTSKVQGVRSVANACEPMVATALLL